MALKDTWVDRVDGVDDASADDINEVAHAVIELEKIQPKEIVIDSEMSDTSDNAVKNKVIKSYVDETANKSNYETILEGELTEGGVSEIATLIPIDLTQFKRLQFFAEVKVAEVASGTSCVHWLTISDKSHTTYNIGLLRHTVTSKGEVDYTWCCDTDIHRRADERYAFWSKFWIFAAEGNNAIADLRTMISSQKESNIVSTTLPPHLLLRITNTTFEAGTKFVLRGVR